MRQGPDLESLRLLTLVARLGSLGAAAAELGIAQPSASKRMSTMERRLGLVLLDRTRRGSRLTEAGQAVASSLLELGSTAAVRGAVVAGTGPAVISLLAVRADLDAGRMVAVDVAGIKLRRALRAVWPAGRTLTGPAAELLALALQRYRPAR
jgi:molybdate transport repressor ModE-like protein